MTPRRATVFRGGGTGAMGIALVQNAGHIVDRSDFFLVGLDPDIARGILTNRENG